MSFETRDLVRGQLKLLSRFRVPFLESAATSGDVPDEVRKKYIEDQKPEEPDDNFKVV
jgi:hypothetical protein